MMDLSFLTHSGISHQNQRNRLSRRWLAVTVQWSLHTSKLPNIFWRISVYWKNISIELHIMF